MPMNFDEWLAATYPDQQPQDENSPVPDGAIDGPAPAYPRGYVEKSGDPRLLNGASPQTVADVAGMKEPEETNDPGEIDFTQTPEEELKAGEQAALRAETPQSQAVSASAGGSGYNFSPEKSAQIAKAGSVLDQRVAADAQPILQDEAATAAGFANVYDQERANLSRRAELEAEQGKLKEELAQGEEDLLREQAFQERLGYVKARAKEEQAMTNYQAAVTQYQAAQVNPGKLWEDMGGAQRFNTAVAVFAHNFLATRGVPTGTMDALNRAIDQNIDAQVRNIEKKGRVAGHFKQMWDMVRAESESDAEARLKMRGLQLAEFKAGAVAKLASMDSDFARLKAQEMGTALDMEYVKTLDQLRQRTRKQLDEERDYNLRRWTAEQQLRLEQWRTSIAAREMKLKEKAAQPVVAWNPELVVRDPAGIDGPEGQAMPIGHARSKEEAVKLEAKLNYQYDAAKTVKRMAELSQELGNIYDAAGRKLFTDKHRDELRSLRLDLVTAKKRALSGLAATDNEQKIFDDIIGQVDSWSKGALGGDSATLVWTASQTMLRDLRKARTDLGTGLSYPGDTSGRGVKINDVPGVFLTEAELKGTRAPNNPETETGRRIGEIYAPGAWQPHNATDEQIASYESAGGERYTYGGPGTFGNVTLDTKQIPTWAVAMGDVAETVKNRSADTTERAQAAAYLEKQVTDYIDKTRKPQLQLGDWEAKGRYATKLYEDLFNDGWIDALGNIREGKESIEGADRPVKDEGY